MNRAQILAMSALFAMGAQNYFDTSFRTMVPERNAAKSNLPAWKIGESVIHARNERDAVKYAKKRGVWKEGQTIQKL